MALTSSSFPGEILHSRFYRRPEDYAGRTIMVVGSFASGSDLSRQLASLNLSNQGGRTKVYVSSSGTPNTHAAASDDSAPWKAHIIDVPLISLVERNSIHFQPASRLDGLTSPPVDDVDTMIFATGYNYAFPFCKVTDRPWCDTRLLDGCIAGLEREGGASWEVGGSKGLGMGGLDGTMVFLKGDGSVAFPALRECMSVRQTASFVLPWDAVDSQGHIRAHTQNIRSSRFPWPRSKLVSQRFHGPDSCPRSLRTQCHRLTQPTPTPALTRLRSQRRTATPLASRIHQATTSSATVTPSPAPQSSTPHNQTTRSIPLTTRQCAKLLRCARPSSLVPLTNGPMKNG